MKNYRVLFYKELLNSDGHSFKCLQQQIDVHSDSPSGALVLAEASIDNARLDVDCVEVVHLADGRNHLEHSTQHSPTPCKHARNRGPKPERRSAEDRHAAPSAERLVRRIS